MDDNLKKVSGFVLDFERDLTKFRPDLTVARSYSDARDTINLTVVDILRNRDNLSLTLDLKVGTIVWHTEFWSYENNLTDVGHKWFEGKFKELRDMFLVGFIREEDEEYEYGVCEELGERTAWVDAQAQAEVVLGALKDVVTGDWKLVRRRKPGEPEFVVLP